MRDDPRLLTPSPASAASLNDWLARIERIHPREIELGLDRVTRVRNALALEPAFPLITVGGTNGKGSICALLEAILGAAGYKVGLYTSPHLRRYNERVRVSRREVSDGALVSAFEWIEAAREVPLTYFEFGTLAAVGLFVDQNVDVAVLEVGLGGRLDAVNAFDADCAVVATIGLDHIEYLGSTRDAIGWEKAGIFRKGCPAICGDEDPPVTLSRHAAAIGADLRVRSRDFGCRIDNHMQWQYWSELGKHAALPWPALRGEFQIGNCAVAIAALEAMRELLPVDMGAIRRGLQEVSLDGRFQIIPGRPQIVLDVGHNVQAAQALAQTLAAMPPAANTVAIFGMLADKDIAGVASALRPLVDRWIVCLLDSPRSAGAAELRAALSRAGVEPSSVQIVDSPDAAFNMARECTGENDRILAFGSFYTVSGVLQAIGDR